MAKGNTIILYNSGVPNDVPNVANLAFGELALNYTDGLLYFKNVNSAIVAFGAIGPVFAAVNVANAIAVQSGAQANSAFNAANTANTIAKQSGLQANSAFVVANTANAIAVQSGLTANAAFNRANQSSGTVSATSFANQVAVYASPGNTVSGLANVNNSILVANATGILSMTNTIPSGITAVTQTWGDNTAAIATDAFVMQALKGIRVNVWVFTSNTVWIPEANLIYATLEAVGGGGGGGSSGTSAGSSTGGGGGGSGGYSKKTINAATAGVSQTINIGQGGLGSSAAGANAGNTIIGTLLIACGGFGGWTGLTSPSFGGAGGFKGTGDYSATGAPGDPGILGTSSVSWATSGSGGSSQMGGGGAGAEVTATSQGSNATGPGGGGGGGATDSSGNVNGGNGFNGQVVITQVCWG
jgi:hypothetical protein